MKYLTYEDGLIYPLCLLVPEISRAEILTAYCTPHKIDPAELLVMDLHYDPNKKKTPASEMKQYIEEELLPIWQECKTEYVICADGDYFKVLTKSTKVDVNLGYVMDCVYGEGIKVVYVPNYRQIFYDPDKIKAKITQGFEALNTHRDGGYVSPGSEIIKFADYPQTPEAIEEWLCRFLDWDRPLTCDVETLSLKHNTAGIGTISFGWSKHEGISFPVDLLDDPEEAKLVRRMLRAFFEQFRAKLIFHNASFDATVLIYQLFMADILDTEGLLEGLRVILRDWDDTRIIAYLASNSCAGNDLSLKGQAQEFAGNWATGEIHNIRAIPLPDLLRYNLIDALSTWFVHEKHWDQMVKDDQLAVYRELFQPAMLDIVQMQLTGLPVDIGQVREVRDALRIIWDDALVRIQGSPLTQRFVHHLRERHVEKRNLELKKKRITLQDAETLAVEFNPNSGPQMQGLLYEMIGLPVISTTDAGQPSVDGDTLEALVHKAKTQDVKDLLAAFLDYGAVNKILTAFIPAMENAAEGPDGWHYLFGNFNLGGTVSGRLSSSDPNLQNLPANVTMVLSQALLARVPMLLQYMIEGELSLGKLIKSCFVAPPGWLFCGYDFSSLEDKISGLTTKDPNKLKVYTDGYDGHCLRAYAYFTDLMPDIDPTSVASINSIKKKYPNQRQDSKVPTFALTYQGTHRTLMVKCGFDQKKALQITAAYHELYKVSDQWVEAKLQEAAKTGYITIAFGLRLRTPLLKQVIRGTRKTPYEATAEGRTAGNALGQSWCLLNSRAGSEIMEQVRDSSYCLDIRPCAQIHDAGYFLVRDDIGALLFANELVAKATLWQDHPDIAHPEVGLGGELSIFYPDWSKEITLPNTATESDVLTLIEKHLAKLTP